MLNKIIKRALEFGFEEVEIVENVSNETNITLFNGNVEKNFSGANKKYTLKGIIDGQMGFLKFEKNEADFTSREIDKLVNQLKNNVLVLSAKEKSSIFEGSKEYPVIEKVDSGLANVSTTSKIKLLKKIEKAAFAYDERIELIPELEYIEEKHSTRIVNSKGLDIYKESEICGAVLETVAGKSKDDPSKQIGFSVKIKNNYNDIDPKEIVKDACKKAISKLGAEPCESGNYEIIFDNDAMKSILSGFLSMFSGESVLKHLSALENKIGEKIMSNKVTLIDDPLMKEAVSREPFDSEGVATTYKEVVKDGVLNTYLHNLKTAKAFGVEPTGNAKGSSIGPMNLYLKPGEKTQAQMIKKIKHGLLITSLQGLHAGLNPISGDFSAQSSGYLIENGKIVRPVTLIVVSGNFLNMMNDIVEIGSDLDMSYNGIGAPSVWFRELPVSGK